MTFVRNSLITATLLAGLAGGVIAQTAPATPGASTPQAQTQTQRRFDPAARQAMFTRKMTELKQALQITPAQEGAWTTFTAAMQPPAQPPRMDREALARMTTPERIDQMRALRAQRNAEMDRRLDATKTFYAALTPEQRKTFDDQSARFLQGGRRGGHHGGHEHHHGAPAR